LVIAVNLPFVLLEYHGQALDCSPQDFDPVRSMPPLPLIFATNDLPDHDALTVVMSHIECLRPPRFLAERHYIPIQLLCNQGQGREELVRDIGLMRFWALLVLPALMVSTHIVHSSHCGVSKISEAYIPAHLSSIPDKVEDLVIGLLPLL
jgi:hypothetical protein